VADEISNYCYLLMTSLLLAPARHCRPPSGKAKIPTLLPLSTKGSCVHDLYDLTATPPTEISLSGRQKTTYIIRNSKISCWVAERPRNERHRVHYTDKAEALELAMFFGSLPPFRYNSRTENALSQSRRGGSSKVIAERTICTMCHGEAFKGMGDVPRVQEQQPQYVIKQLKDLRDGRRTNDGGSMKGRWPSF